MARFLEVAAVHFSHLEGYAGSVPRRSVLDQFAAAARRLDGTGIGLVVTCEGMESVGQAMDEAESLDRPGPLLGAYADFARRNRCTVVGSLKLAEAAGVANAQVAVGPAGTALGIYRKTFLTAGERAKGMVAGPGATVVETPAGRIGGAICFDLNFPELRQAYHRLHPDILAFSSMYHGGLVQAAWAYETRAFFIGATKDALSEVRDPLGRVLASANAYSQVARARINLDRVLLHCDGNQERFPALHRDLGGRVRIEVLADLGVALLTCDDPDRTCADLMREHGLVALDDYLEAARR